MALRPSAVEVGWVLLQLLKDNRQEIKMQIDISYKYIGDWIKDNV